MSYLFKNTFRYARLIQFYKLLKRKKNMFFRSFYLTMATKPSNALIWYNTLNLSGISHIIMFFGINRDECKCMLLSLSTFKRKQNQVSKEIETILLLLAVRMRLYEHIIRVFSH